MVTWDDLAIEFNKMTEALEKMTEAFGRCERSFESLTKSYQEMITYAHILQTRLARLG